MANARPAGSPSPPAVDHVECHRTQNEKAGSQRRGFPTMDLCTTRSGDTCQEQNRYEYGGSASPPQENSRPVHPPIVRNTLIRLPFGDQVPIDRISIKLDEGTPGPTADFAHQLATDTAGLDIVPLDKPGSPNFPASGESRAVASLSSLLTISYVGGKMPLELTRRTLDLFSGTGVTEASSLPEPLAPEDRGDLHGGEYPHVREKVLYPEELLCIEMSPPPPRYREVSGRLMQ